jgi:hypothetical protein
LVCAPAAVWDRSVSGCTAASSLHLYSPTPAVVGDSGDYAVPAATWDGVAVGAAKGGGGGGGGTPSERWRSMSSLPALRCALWPLRKGRAGPPPWYACPGRKGPVVWPPSSCLRIVWPWRASRLRSSPPPLPPRVSVRPRGPRPRQSRPPRCEPWPPRRVVSAIPRGLRPCPLPSPPMPRSVLTTGRGASVWPGPCTQPRGAVSRWH